MLNRAQFKRAQQQYPAPGETPVAPGHVRMYHYTRRLNEGESIDDRMRSLKQHGIRIDHARGETYGEPNLAWGSTKSPDSDDYFVEAHVPLAEVRDNAVGLPWSNHKGETDEDTAAKYNEGDHNFGLGQDVKPEWVKAVHTPWKHHLRYLNDNYAGSVKESPFSGDYDSIDPEYARAARAHDARVQGGG